MVKFEITDSLKDHYFFEYSIDQLIETFVLLFEVEKKELLRRFQNRLESLYGEPSFSPTIYNISDMIVFKYFNDGLCFCEKAFVRCNKFKGYPFHMKIKELEPDIVKSV